MEYTDILRMLAGLALFLFGMSLMGAALEKRAGNRLKQILSKLTASPARGFFLGLVVTAVIQSSSATTVMVVGFVNSGLMKLSQSVGIIIGANVGTAVTSWILSLTGIQGSAWYVEIFKPSTFTPVIAVVGLLFYMMSKSERRRDTGSILLGFTVLMFGMETMSGAVKPLTKIPEFVNILTMFSNPILGVLVGAAFTAIVQSSSASVGVLQALSMTGVISYSSAIPIVLGQNIGTCVTAMISSSGASTDARRASMIHLYFNVIGVAVWLGTFYLINAIFTLPLVAEAATPFGIAIIHTVFKLLSTILLMPFSKQLEKLAVMTVKDKGQDPEKQLLDERLFVTPAVAIARARNVTQTMASIACGALSRSLTLIDNYDEKVAQTVASDESRADRFEDMLGTYLVKLGEQQLSMDDSHEQSKLLHMIGDFERISDHAVNIMESALEIHDKKLVFSAEAKREINTMCAAVNEALSLSYTAFTNDDLDSAMKVEPLEQVVDILQKQIRTRHIDRLTKGICSIEQGFVLSDILGNLERVSDHCSNIAGCVIEIRQNSMDVHSYLNEIKRGDNRRFNEEYKLFSERFALTEK